MKLIYGYELNAAPGQVGHVVCPPLLADKITVSLSGNTNRWIFYGVRKDIIAWLREHADIRLENNIFAGQANTKPAHVHTELVIDLQYVYDQEQSYGDYIKSYFVDIFETERVKVEIRPKVDAKDNMITALNRVIVANGSRLGDIADDLELEWYKPTDSYVKQTKDLFLDTPVENHILSAKPPTSVHISEPKPE